MKRSVYEPYFKGKKITLMGLGVLGRGLQITQFLAECGAKLTVTDLKDKKGLETSLKALAKYKIRFVLGKHDLKDFEKADLIVKAAGVPLNSKYIKHAQSKNIPIAMDASLFAKLIKDIKPKITLIGITGTRGKSMTTALTYHILKKNEKVLGGKVYMGGNMRGKATLPLIKKIHSGDFVVLELDSWQLQGFGDEKISPHIAVFTNLMDDHMNYYKENPRQYLGDKANIYRFQNEKDVFITNKKLLKILPNKPKSKVTLPAPHVNVSISGILGAHNAQNAAYAIKVAEAVGLNNQRIRRALKTFRGLEGRLEYLGKKRGIHLINDNNSTTPEATVAGLEAVGQKYPDSNIILICGGADKGLEFKGLVNKIKKLSVKTIFLPGTGTERLKKELPTNFIEVKTLNEAMRKAFEDIRKDNVILFSPGFASFGLFANEYDRNDKFIRIVKHL